MDRGCDVALILYRSQLNIQPLYDLALKDIESKLSEDNIVEELFSRIIAKRGSPGLTLDHHDRTDG